jgi:hypothetical protein
MEGGNKKGKEKSMGKELEIKNNEEKEKKGERFMVEENVISGEVVKKKRGPKPKEKNEEIQESKEQNKFFIDVSKEIESRDLIRTLLQQANLKNYGREITLKDLVIAALLKLKPIDVEKIQENSLSDMEKVQRTCDEYNKKHNTSLDLGEYLIKIRKIE